MTIVDSGVPVGSIFACPATWGSRLRTPAVGFTLITAYNIVRLGHRSLIAENRAPLDLLHLYVWPGILILVAAGFVYVWMGRQGFGGRGATVALSGPIIRTADRRDVARERWCERIRDSTSTNTGATGNDGRADGTILKRGAEQTADESWPHGQIS